MHGVKNQFSMKQKAYLLIPIYLLLSGCGAEPEQSNIASEEPTLSEKLWTEKDRQFILDELDRTTKELIKEIDDLAIDQWTFREDPNRWDIAEIVEHLTVQNELHYREITAISNVPEMPQYLPITTGQDGHFQKYATDPAKSQAKWFLHPINRFCSKRQSQDAFLRARDGLRDFVEATDADLRKHFAFRNDAGSKPIDEIKIGDVRDLHQLLLTGIAHTDRHIAQIKRLKKHPSYPREI